MALVTTTEMFKKAYAGGYAIGAFNINNMEIVQAITEAAGEVKSPSSCRSPQARGSTPNRRTSWRWHRQPLPTAALTPGPASDHGADFDICKACIDGGFSSVMIDGSKHSFEDNIALTRKVVEYAHAHGVVVEGELGKLAGIEDDVHVDAADSSYTQPNEVEEFVTRTGVDSLAIAIGTSHGAYKFTPEQCTRNADGVLVPPPLRFDILEEVSRRLPGFPIVLHGASSVPQELVREINALGGKMPDAIGIPEEQLRRAATMAVCKINIDSDIRLAMTAAIRRTFAEKPSVFDPREYLGAGREAVKAMVKHKIVDVLGSDNTLDPGRIYPGSGYSLCGNPIRVLLMGTCNSLLSVRLAMRGGKDLRKISPRIHTARARHNRGNPSGKEAPLRRVPQVLRLCLFPNVSRRGCRPCWTVQPPTCTGWQPTPCCLSPHC